MSDIQCSYSQVHVGSDAQSHSLPSYQDPQESEDHTKAMMDFFPSSDSNTIEITIYFMPRPVFVGAHPKTFHRRLV